MAHYKLVENSEPDHARYDLYCDDVLVLETKKYGEIYEYIHIVMKEEDTLQEVHPSSRFEFPILSYTDVIRAKQRHEKFDRGE